jgi:hypothetical protein
MVSYHRPKSGHITCYLNRTYHVLPTPAQAHVDNRIRREYCCPDRHFQARRRHPIQVA